MTDAIGPTCNTPDCRGPRTIAGYCPPCAIERYRRQAVRSTPALRRSDDE